jgi:DNA-binding transcriptional LysR family regulator
MDWDKLRVFHAVAEAGSFTHAGETLNLSQSAVSRQISALEESLAVPLFHRHARGLILTEQGETLNKTVRDVFAKLAMTEALLSESKERPTGRLKVTTTTAFGATWLAGRIKEFLDLYPDITMSMVLDDSELDLAMREADVAIRLHPPRQPDLVQRHLLTIGYRVMGSPEYLKKHGTPQVAEDLDNHRLVVFGDHRPPVENINWLLDAGRKPGAARRAILEMNSITGMLRAVDTGLARLHEGRDHPPGPGAARTEGADDRGLFRLPGGAAEFEARGGVPRLPAGQDRRHGLIQPLTAGQPARSPLV